MRAICPRCGAALEMTRLLYFNLTKKGIASPAVGGIGDWTLNCLNGHEINGTGGLEDFTSAQTAADHLLAPFVRRSARSVLRGVPRRIILKLLPPTCVRLTAPHPVGGTHV